MVAASPAALNAAVGVTNVIGPFTNRLSNAGEKLQVRDNNDRLMDQVNYGVEGDWPVAPDGAGPSLARRRANLRGSDSRNWLPSAQIGGTPGAENFPVKGPTIISNIVAGIESTWRFNDTGMDLGPAWRDSSYDDSSWLTGAALFFQGAGPLPAAKNLSRPLGHRY